MNEKKNKEKPIPFKLDDFFTPDETFNYMGQLYDMTPAEITERKDILFYR